MVSIILNSKDGKIISYKCKSCVGRDDCRKQMFRCMTRKVPGGLSPTKKITAYFEGSNLQKITPAKIQEFIIFLRTEKGFSPRNVHRHYRTLNMIFPMRCGRRYC